MYNRHITEVTKSKWPNCNPNDLIAKWLFIGCIQTISFFTAFHWLYSNSLRRYASKVSCRCVSFGKAENEKLSELMIFTGLIHQTLVQSNDKKTTSKDDLKFHDSGQDDVLYDRTDGQTITFSNFPTSAVSDEEEEEEDKSQLLKDKKTPSFWTFEYYQQFFDVDSHQVLSRILGSMTPLPTRNYLKSHIRPNPDLYGPFWICTTLVFTTAIAGNLANYLSLGGKDYTWRYDFHKVTIASSAIFSYWWLVPAMLYGVLWYRKSDAGYTFSEILCLYGYSLAIYIPISILWVINFTWLRWLLVIMGAITSGGVLVITFWPAVKDDTKQIAYGIIGLVFLFHLLLAAGFVLYFFHVPATTSPSSVVSTTTAAPVVIPTKPKNIPHSLEQAQPGQNVPNKTEDPVETPPLIDNEKNKAPEEVGKQAADNEITNKAPNKLPKRHDTGNDVENDLPALVGKNNVNMGGRV